MRLFLLFVCLYGALPAALAQDDEMRFIRFTAGDEPWQGRLQTAIVSYENNRGVQLDLVAAVHIADTDYYRRLNAYFAQRDVVLYELVADPEQRPTPGARVSGDSLIGLLQRAVAGFLDLGFQLQQVDYSVPNFRHADLSLAQLETIMAAKNETFFTLFLNLAMAQMASEQARRASGELPRSALSYAAVMEALAAQDSARAIKFLLARELGRAGGVLLTPELEDQVTVLGDRNRVALGVLEETLGDSTQKRISLFYGAAHMPGLERALTGDMGFTRTSHYWLDAWTIP